MTRTATTTQHVSSPLHLSVIGCGYLGAVHAAAMASIGHRVTGVDVDPARAAALSEGRAPFYEPGFDALLASVVDTGRLRFTTDPAAIAGATVHFLCVGTPQAEGDYHADLSYLEAAVDSLLPLLEPGHVVVGKCTVPVGTAAGLAERIRATGATLLWNPEFLREGFAIDDTLRPDRVVLGMDDPDSPAVGVMRRVYEPLLETSPLIVTDFATAELAKAACNAFLATKISFINAMAQMCELADGDVTALAEVMGHDERIGRRFLGAGLGFGGGCLPKDIHAFAARAVELGADDVRTLLNGVHLINESRRDRAVALVREWAGGELAGFRVAALGATFKPDTDDIRDSPSLAVAAALQRAGAEVTVTDPKGLANAGRAFPDLRLAETVDEAVRDADVVLLLTEWQAFRELDPEAVGKLVTHRRVLDGRNVLDRDAWVAAGWEYRALGRPSGDPVARA